MSVPATVLFSQNYADGGSVTSLLDLVRGLDPDRYRAVVAFRGPNAFIEEFEAAGAVVEILAPETATATDDSEDEAASLVRQLPAGRRTGLGPLRRFLSRSVRSDLPAARALWRVAHRHHVDLIHANNDVRMNRDAIVVAWMMRIPLACHVRWLYDSSAPVDLWVDRRMARVVDQFFFISAAAQRCYEPVGVSADRTLVLDNPFDVPALRAPRRPELVAQLGLEGDDPIVLGLGRLTPWKGQDVVIRALAVIREDLPARLLLVGAATDARGRTYEAQLRVLVEDLDLADQVVFAGARRDIAEVLAIADVVVHSSTKAEPFGRAVVEAMAAGRPLVASDGGGVPEVVDDGVTGLLVVPGDPGVLAAAVVRLLVDPDRAAAMGRRAAVATEARFGIEAHCQPVQAAYDRILERL